jgi:hypothetical protein
MNGLTLKVGLSWFKYQLCIKYQSMFRPARHFCYLMLSFYCFCSLCIHLDGMAAVAVAGVVAVVVDD